MTMGINGVFKCLCPPKYSGPLCEGKPLLKQIHHVSFTVNAGTWFIYTIRKYTH